jgi:hypothetical protein
MLVMKYQIVFGVVAKVATIGLLAAANNVAYAKIGPLTSDTGCINGGGNQPGSQATMSLTVLSAVTG